MFFFKYVSSIVVFWCFVSKEQGMFVYFWSVYTLAIEFETFGGRVVSSLRVFPIIWRIFNYFVFNVVSREQGMFVLLFWISVHSCSRIWSILTSNLPGGPRIHCEIACLRLFNVFWNQFQTNLQLWLHLEFQHAPSPIHCLHSCRLPASHCWTVCSILVK